MPEEEQADDATFRIVPGDQLPTGANVVPLQIGEQLVWLLREGADLQTLVDEMNRYAAHIVRHGLWEPKGGGTNAPPRPAD